MCNFLNLKRRAILGMIGCIVPIIVYYIDYYMVLGEIVSSGLFLIILLGSILGNLVSLGLFFYFLIILLRIIHKKVIVNTKIMKTVPIIFIFFALIQIVYSFINNYYMIDVIDFIHCIVTTIYYIILGLYLLNIFFDKKNFVKNNIFIISSLVFIVINICRWFIYALSHELEDIPKVYLTDVFMAICILPYFCSYYRLKKGED